ncbi:MAG: tryptophan synthase subunit alpha [Sphaerochaetaceae bacterium]
MNDRIKHAFFENKAFIPFVTCGDPDISLTEDLVLAMEEAGADLIELGLPFSDPIAEGPVIQQADERALASGFKVEQLFSLVTRLRSHTEIPLVCMTYLNPVYRYQKERFLVSAKQAGLDGLIIPDLPFEEQDEIKGSCQANAITLISMIAPTSEKRIIAVSQQSEGFLYCVSSLGVTGMRDNLNDRAKEMVALAKASCDTPCAVGFGIHTPEQAHHIADYADGIIVGSAIVNMIAEQGKKSVKPVSQYVREMKQAISG